MSGAAEVIASGAPVKKWTRAECYKLEASGLFKGQRYELIGGYLIDKMGKTGGPHAASMSALLSWLTRGFDPLQILTSVPIELRPEDSLLNAPQPDAMVLRRPARESSEAGPQPSDVALVVEISSGSTHLNFGPKAALYSRAGIEDYWVIDIPRRRLVVFREPSEQRYGSVFAYTEDEALTPLAAPAASVLVSDLLPRA